MGSQWKTTILGTSALFLVLLNVVDSYYTSRPVKIENYKDHPCIRQCIDGENMVCVYNFTIERYLSLSKACYDCPNTPEDCDRPHCIPADGSQCSVISINRMIPGPNIVTCEGDTVVVNVINMLINGEATAIHWHGIHMKGTPWMDGANLVTQCSINKDSSFQYRFETDVRGTYWSHAHAGFQKSQGMLNALVVRQPSSKNVHSALYDHDLNDHILVINDWYFPTLTEWHVRMYHGLQGVPDIKALMINGRATLESNNAVPVPYQVFEVEYNHRYRFRKINGASSSCPIRISIDQHPLTVIATDGFDVHPKTVDYVQSFTGERYDFVLHANQSIGSYWMRISVPDGCVRSSRQFYAILRYKNAPIELPVSNEVENGITLNPRIGKVLDASREVAITELESTTPINPALRSVDVVFYLEFDVNRNVDNYHYSDPDYYPRSAFERDFSFPFQINQITGKFPHSPLVSQFEDVSPELFCNASTVSHLNLSTTFCECIHLIKAPLNARVEMVLFTLDTIVHNFHLHGFTFDVVGIGGKPGLGSYKELNEANQLPKNLVNPVMKDTVTIPRQGYTVIRFLADNPGFWLIHCHMETHVNQGLFMILQVGELSQMHTPPRNIPRCGNFKPPGAEPNARATRKYPRVWRF